MCVHLFWKGNPVLKCINSGLVFEVFTKAINFKLKTVILQIALCATSHYELKLDQNYKTK